MGTAWALRQPRNHDTNEGGIGALCAAHYERVMVSCLTEQEPGLSRAGVSVGESALSTEERRRGVVALGLCYTKATMVSIDRRALHTDPPNESHDVHSERLMSHAQEQLDRKDRLQASEKAWGAAAHALKALAKERGWPNTTHKHLGRAIQRLKAENPFDADRIQVLWLAAQSAHSNFYEDTLALEDIEGAIKSARELRYRLNQMRRPKRSPTTRTTPRRTPPRR